MINLQHIKCPPPLAKFLFFDNGKNLIVSGPYLRISVVLLGGFYAILNEFRGQVSRLFRGPRIRALFKKTIVSAPRFISKARPRRPAFESSKPSVIHGNENLKGKCFVIDGDTIVISGTRIRLAGIDAPEMDQPYGKKSKFAMMALCKGKAITAEIQEDVSYDRIVAKCYLPDGTDVSAELVKQGLALDWAKFSGGAYRHLEPEGARKKLWRVSAKHQGRLKLT